jgi:LAS superfamily LD-carboxypeptidase LdcB
VKPSRRSRAARLLAVSIIAIAPVLAPSQVSALPGQEPPDGGEAPDGGPGSPADVDLLRASGPSTTVTASFEELSSEVRRQVDAVVAARSAAADAEAALDEADAAVAETEAEIQEIDDETGEVVVDAFIDPPAEDALVTLTDASLAESTVRQEILTGRADEHADVLDRLAAAEAELDGRKAEQEEAAAEAEALAEEAATAFDDLVAAQSAETLFVLAVEERIDAGLAEAEALEDLDPEAAERVRAREREVAEAIEGVLAARAQRAREEEFFDALAEAQAEAERQQAEQEAREAAGPVTIGAPSGSLATAACPGGGSITVDSSLAGNLADMLRAASADGLNLCGNGYRDPAAQVAVRMANCGTSHYAIYEAPSSSCSPPTAPPGTSEHEKGLAIDFTCNGGGAIGTSSPCFVWLQSHAASYGLYNLPAEPWHWSADGT